MMQLTCLIGALLIDLVFSKISSVIFSSNFCFCFFKLLLIFSRNCSFRLINVFEIINKMKFCYLVSTCEIFYTLVFK